MSRKIPALLALVAAAGLALGGCGSASDSASPASSGAPAASGAADSSQAATQPSSVTIEDNRGTTEVSLPVKRAASTDNRTFEVLAQWNVPLVAVPKGLMPSTVTAYNGDDVVDLGNHREPRLEALVGAQPDLIISGQRFSQFNDQMTQLNPGVPLLDLEPRKDQPLDAELTRQVDALGKIFNKEAEAARLVTDFNNALARAKAAYDGTSTVMAVNVSGGEIGYVAPSAGRTWGPIFDLVGLKPALQVEGASDNHKGDDISVEAIAQSNPDWLLVLDRDGAISAGKDGYTPAKDVIAGNSALQGVTAVSKGQAVYAPQDTYTNESIITYTEIFDLIAEAFTTGTGNGQ